MRRLITALSLVFLVTHASAAGLSELSSAEARAGLKDALIQSAGKAVGKLGAVDGFFGNPKVKIPLPDPLKKTEKALHILGVGKQADELVLRMNRAAEAAVPEAKVLLVDAVKKMSVDDAKSILTGGEDAATQYFRKVTSGPMAERFLPIVKKATEDVALAKQYNKLAQKANSYGFVKKEQVNLEQYVTQKTLDGVYLIMAEEEKAIRQNPMAASTNLIKKVFGTLSR